MPDRSGILHTLHLFNFHIQRPTPFLYYSSLFPPLYPRNSTLISTSSSSLVGGGIVGVFHRIHSIYIVVVVSFERYLVGKVSFV